MEKPPVSRSLFRQALEQAGIEFNTTPLKVIRPQSNEKMVLTTWEGLVEKLISEQ